MKRTALLKKISKAAKTAGLAWDLYSEGAEHSIYKLDGQKIAIPRHREINEYTAQGILKDTEDELGKGWWR